MEKLLTIDIADIKVSNDPSVTLVTYALGSCIAVIVFDPVNRYGGMIHYMLPFSTKSPEKAAKNPAMFADTGIPRLFEQMYALGSKKENLVVKVAGGGQLYDDKGTFNIGKRNYTVMRKMFWKNNIIVSAEDVGGAKSRTAKLRLSDGRVTVKVKGVESVL
ncbi:MAG: chemotaxis protein CheD [Deltaproteobacteria bacterium]|nr:chemotaxis protein CheD [Deltaproteobacteria bacterium]MBN2674558.1 chemotaxis protein CheD [Deltaproteobacteria bacterium]